MEGSDDTALYIGKSGLKLIGILLQACSIPVFADGILQQIEKEGDYLVYTIKIIHIDLISQVHYVTVINASFDAILWMGKNQLTPLNRENIRTKLYKETVIPILSKMPPGKSRMNVLRKAYEKNIPFIHLGDGVYQLGWGCRGVKFDRSTVAFDSAIGSRMSQNKIVASNLIRMAGLPSPEHRIAVTVEKALNIASDLNYPVVVKPIDLDRGEGVSIDIDDDQKLTLAFENVVKLSPNKPVIIEKQVPGVCYRFFVINERLLYAVKRSGLSIEADGDRSIEKLIDDANELELCKVPWDTNKTFYPKDDTAIESIAKAGFTLNSIPSKGVWIPLRDKESTQWGGKIDDVTHMVHHENVKIALRAAKLFNLHVAGVDIITSDISKPWYETGAIINEVNYAPMLGGHPISKGYLSTYLEYLIPENGRIPIEVFVGGEEAFDAAVLKHQSYCDRGIKSYLTSHNQTLSYRNSVEMYPFDKLYLRVKALVLNHEVEALVVVVQTDEYKAHGFALDNIDTLHLHTKEGMTSMDGNCWLSQDDFEMICNEMSALFSP